MPRTKPLKYVFEKDIVMYARFNRLDYFSTECKYAPDSFRNFVRYILNFNIPFEYRTKSITMAWHRGSFTYRMYVKKLEKLQPKAILDLIKSGEAISARSDVFLPTLTTCER